MEAWQKIAADPGYGMDSDDDVRGVGTLDRSDRSDGGGLKSLEKDDEQKMITTGPSVITNTITSQNALIGTTSVLTGLAIEVRRRREAGLRGMMMG